MSSCILVIFFSFSKVFLKSDFNASLWHFWSFSSARYTSIKESNVTFTFLSLLKEFVPVGCRRGSITFLVTLPGSKYLLIREPLLRSCASVFLLNLWAKSVGKVGLAQLNEYQTDPYFLQLSQNMANNCAFAFVFLPEFTCFVSKIICFDVQNNFRHKTSKFSEEQTKK